MIRTKELIVGDAIDLYAEQNIIVAVSDEGAGPFIEISNVGSESVRIDFKEWPEISEAVNKLKEEWAK